MIVTCKVIEDLLPLYADGICSDDTKIVVEHHTAECADCRKKLEAMTSETIERKKIGTDKPSPKNPFKKIRRHYTRLIVCTLLICAAVLIPSALIFSLYINDEIDKGISFSSIAVSRKLKEFGNMFKRGEYRQALDSVELYYQEGYTAAEIAAFKEMFAADLDEYFKKFPIKKVRVKADGGKCESGYVILYLDADKYKGTGQEPTLHLYFEVRKTDFNSYVMTLGGSECWTHSDSEYLDYDRELSAAFPPLQLIQHDRAEYILDNLKKEYNHIFWFWFFTEERLVFDNENVDDGIDISKGDIVSSVYLQKLKKLLLDYSYIGCENSTMTYTQEDILDYSSHFIQHVVMTMSSEETGDFTAEFDMPILNDGGFTHLRNVSYSDNAPDDFRQRFEDIFVNDAPVYGQYQEQKLNDGKFCLNGNAESCYYEVRDGKIQLVMENERQSRELYEAELANAVDEAVRNRSYEDWYSSKTRRPNEPSEYKIMPNKGIGIYVFYNNSYTPDGEMMISDSVGYIDSDRLMNNNCVFIRV